MHTIVFVIAGANRPVGWRRTDPNLQNIPVRSDAGRRIREAFIADEGKVLVIVLGLQPDRIADFGACGAEIDALKQAFQRRAAISTP